MGTEPLQTSRPPSQASTVVRELDPGRAAMTPPHSVSRSPAVQHSTPSASSAVSARLRDHAQRYEMPQDGILTLEYGEDMQSRRTISEEWLHRHSKTFPSFCEDAKKLRNKYRRCDEIKEELASLSVLMTSKMYEEKGVEDQIMKLIERVRDHYPLGDYQNSIKEILKDTADAQVTLRNVKPQCSVKATSREYKDMVLMGRLRLLNHKGMLVVCDRLIGKFTRNKASEKAKAEEDNLTALAQKRLRLRGISEQSIQSLAAWLEHGRLHCETDKQLYDLYKLAARLRVDVLLEECLNQLFDTTSDIIQQAYSQGSSLQRLLGLDEPDGRDQALDQYNPPESAVKVIFESVLNSEHPPARLSELVSNLLAKHMDLELWEHLKTSVNHQFTLYIVDAMVAQREVKAEVDLDDGGHIKLESYREVTNAQREASKAHQQSVLNG